MDTFSFYLDFLYSLIIQLPATPLSNASHVSNAMHRMRLLSNLLHCSCPALYTVRYYLTVRTHYCCCVLHSLLIPYLCFLPLLHSYALTCTHTHSLTHTHTHTYTHTYTHTHTHTHTQDQWGYASAVEVAGLYSAGPVIFLPPRHHDHYDNDDEEDEDNEDNDDNEDYDNGDDDGGEKVAAVAKQDKNEDHNENERVSKEEIIENESIDWIDKVSWTSVLNSSIEKQKSRDEIKKFVSANIGLSNKKKKKLRSASFCEFENKNKKLNEMKSDGMNTKEKKILSLVIDLSDQKNKKEDEKAEMRLISGNRLAEDSKMKEVEKEVEGRKIDTSLTGEVPQGFLEMDLGPLECNAVWTKGAVRRHKLLTRIIADWLDLLVAFEYL